jgi:hypothetical protein
MIGREQRKPARSTGERVSKAIVIAGLSVIWSGAAWAAIRLIGL